MLLLSVLLALPASLLAVEGPDLPVGIPPASAIVDPKKPASVRKTIQFADNGRGPRNRVQEVQKGLVGAQGDFANFNVDGGASGGVLSPRKNFHQAALNPGNGKKGVGASALGLSSRNLGAVGNGQTAYLRGRKENSGGTKDTHAALAANNAFLDTVEKKKGSSVDRYEAENDNLLAKNIIDNWRGNSGSGTFETVKKGKGGRGKRKNPEFNLWTVSKSGDDTTTTLKDKDASRGRGFNAECTAAKIGESLCTDAQGKTVGKVVTDSDLNAQVYAPVAGGRAAVPVAKSKCVERREQEGTYDCVLGRGVFEATVEDYQEYDCIGEYGVPGNTDLKIEFDKEAFAYNHETQSGQRKKFKFPDCFEMSSEISLENFTPEQRKDFGRRLAFEWDVNILPAGKLHCKDPATCPTTEDSCYYCKGCDRTKEREIQDVFGNWDSKDLCDAGDQKTFRTKTNVCPPPETFQWAHCYSFGYDVIPSGKDLKNKDRKGDLHATQLFYLLPPNWDRIVADCRGKANGFGRIKLALEYSTAFSRGDLSRILRSRGKSINLNPSTQDLIDFCAKREVVKWVESRFPNAEDKYDISKGELIGCKRSEVKYSLGGSNAGANRALLRGVGKASSISSLFNDKKCPNLKKKRG